MASSIVIFVKLSNYESSNTFSSYLKTISKSFYCKNAKVYISRIYSPNCDLKLWIIFEFGNLLHRFTDHSTFLYIKACKDSGSQSYSLYSFVLRKCFENYANTAKMFNWDYFLWSIIFYARA